MKELARLHYKKLAYVNFEEQKILQHLFEQDFDIVPLEVKAETNVKAKSLRQFVIDNHPKRALRISMNDHKKEDWVENLPLYAVGAWV